MLFYRCTCFYMHTHTQQHTHIHTHRAHCIRTRAHCRLLRRRKSRRCPRPRPRQTQPPLQRRRLNGCRRRRWPRLHCPCCLRLHTARCRLRRAPMASRAERRRRKPPASSKRLSFPSSTYCCLCAVSTPPARVPKTTSLLRGRHALRPKIIRVPHPAGSVCSRSLVMHAEIMRVLPMLYPRM